MPADTSPTPPPAASTPDATGDAPAAATPPPSPADGSSADAPTATPDADAEAAAPPLATEPSTPDATSAPDTTFIPPPPPPPPADPADALPLPDAPVTTADAAFAAAPVDPSAAPSARLATPAYAPPTDTPLLNSAPIEEGGRFADPTAPTAQQQIDEYSCAPANLTPLPLVSARNLYVSSKTCMYQHS